MKKFYLTTSVIVLFVLCTFSIFAQEKQTIVVVFDGLRPDYITPEIMPNTYQLSQVGCVSINHHSIFPTVTRVNSAALATGAYPGTNGLMGNSVYFPEIDPVKGISTDDANALMNIQKQTKGKLLTSLSLSEILKQNKKGMMVFSSGSTGQSYLLNHTAYGSNAIVNPSLILPASFTDTLIKAVGEIPLSDKKSQLRHTWITNAFLHFGLQSNNPSVSIVWYSDPDGTAHSHSVGSAKTLESITYVDNEFGRILNEIKVRGLENKVNILVTSDHGFVTHTGKNNVAKLLIEKGIKKDSNSEDVVVVGGAIYVKGKDATKINDIVSVLQQEEWIGALFTNQVNKKSIEGSVLGTFSFDVINYNHTERKPDIVFDLAWDSIKNEFGYPGRSCSYGIAGHGCSSPYEIGIYLIAKGPDFKSGNFKSHAPTNNVDIVPTILHLNNIKPSKKMDGRIMFELLSNNQEKSTPENSVLESHVDSKWGSYKVEANISSYKNKKYINFTKTNREKK